MIGNSPIDYVVIRTSIAGLRVVAPASIGYIALCALRPGWLYLPVAFVAAAEAAFYLLVYLPRRRRLQEPPRHAPLLHTRAQRQVLFERSSQAESHGEPKGLPYPTGWFFPRGATPRREDVVDWLLWALFSTSREQTDIDEHQEELEGYIRAIEELLGVPLAPGWSDGPGLRSMRITLDPVVMLHRPLVWYLIVALVDTYTSLFLTYLGFTHYTPRDPQWRRTFPPRPILHLLSRYGPEGAVTPYWYRAHTSTSERPLVFLHGIGIGLYPYIPFLRSLISADTGVGILLPEMMSICMHMTPRSVPPREEMLASLNSILESLQDEEQRSQQPKYDNGAQTPLLGAADTDSPRRGWDSVVLAAHSYGTFVAGWAVRDCTLPAMDGGASSGGRALTDKIAHLVLVDPIPILLSNPAVAHNFLYREPGAVCPRRLGGVRNGVGVGAGASGAGAGAGAQDNQEAEDEAWYSSPAAWQLWYCASRDADIAHTLFRTFFWAEGGLWREDLDAWVGGAGGEGTDGDAGSGSGAWSGTGRTNGRNVAVVLGGMDQIVPAEVIRRYLTGDAAWSARWVGEGTGRGAARVEEEEDQRRTGYGSTASSRAGDGGGAGKLEVLFNPVLDHAVLFDRPECFRALIDVVRRYVRE